MSPRGIASAAAEHDGRLLLIVAGIAVVAGLLLGLSIAAYFGAFSGAPA